MAAKVGFFLKNKKKLTISAAQKRCEDGKKGVLRSLNLVFYPVLNLKQLRFFSIKTDVGQPTNSSTKISNRCRNLCRVKKTRQKLQNFRFLNRDFNLRPRVFYSQFVFFN
jgi:hypothetical protein